MSSEAHSSIQAPELDFEVKIPAGLSIHPPTDCRFIYDGSPQSASSNFSDDESDPSKGAVREGGWLVASVVRFRDIWTATWMYRLFGVILLEVEVLEKKGERRAS